MSCPPVTAPRPQSWSLLPCVRAEESVCVRMSTRTRRIGGVLLPKSMGAASV